MSKLRTNTSFGTFNMAASYAIDWKQKVILELVKRFNRREIGCNFYWEKNEQQ